MYSLVTLGLNYFNSVLSRLLDTRTAPLQQIQNIAAGIVSCSKPQDNITLVLKSLHWLPIKPRIRFKVLLMSYRAVKKLSSSYLCDLVDPDIKERDLCSRHHHRLKLQNSRLVCYGNRGFKVATPKEWVKYPLNIKQSPTVDCLKSRLKTYLFDFCFK